jgi:hypothetical protein
MDTTLRTLRPWLIFGGTVLVVFILWEMSEVLVPIAVAALLAFLLTPLVTILQRRIGRVAAVLIVVIGCSVPFAAGARTTSAPRSPRPGSCSVSTAASSCPSPKTNRRASR